MLYMPDVHSTEANVWKERAGAEGHEHTKHGVWFLEENLAAPPAGPTGELLMQQQEGPIFLEACHGPCFITIYIRPI